jgi:hypothetical protein
MAGCLAYVQLWQHSDGNLTILWLKVSDSLIVLGIARGGWTAESRIRFRYLPSFTKMLNREPLHQVTMEVWTCQNLASNRRIILLTPWHQIWPDIAGLSVVRSVSQTSEHKPCFDGFSGLVVSILATGTRVRGFKPGRSRWIFWASGKSSVCLPSEG